MAAHDLVLHDLTPPALLGRDRELLAAPRLDNLSSAYCGLAGFLAATAAGGTEDAILLYAAFDHEEVGNGSATGVAGPLLGPSCGTFGPPISARCCPTARP